MTHENDVEPRLLDANLRNHREPQRVCVPSDARCQIGDRQANMMNRAERNHKKV